MEEMEGKNSILQSQIHDLYVSGSLQVECK